MTRREIVEFAKGRASAYIEVGQYKEAIDSFLSDLNSHDETREMFNNLSASGMLARMEGTREAAVRFINGVPS